MKNILIFCAAALLVCSACKKDKLENSKKQEVPEIAINFDAFGAEITAQEAMSSDEMLAKFSHMKVGDTINAKFTSIINEVCSKKGCWMKLPVGEKETMVRFKDYGFFMPLDAINREVILAGKAFVQETSVEELRHYAEDAGKTKREIAMIIAPKKEFAFEANAVLLKK